MYTRIGDGDKNSDYVCYHTTGVDEISNETLKKVFEDLRATVAKDVNPDHVIDFLFSKKVLGDEDYHALRQDKNSRERCDELLSLLHRSSHPEAFVRLRQALVDDYQWIVVEEIDKQLASATGQLRQQSQLEKSEDGTFCSGINFFMC